MFQFVRKIAVVLLALGMSFGLLISIPLLHVWLRSGGVTKTYTKTQVSLKQLPPEQKQQQKANHEPKRAQPTQRSLKSGPRFAMDLGAIGGSGAAISTDLLKAPGGGGAQGGVLNGDVDEKPRMSGSPAFQAPDAIKNSEVDAHLRLSFCVDANGRPYDIRVIEESPAGKGLGDAGREAVSHAQFQPARKSGTPVPFCGLEQPFEIKFRD